MRPWLVKSDPHGLTVVIYVSLLREAGQYVTCKPSDMDKAEATEVGDSFEIYAVLFVDTGIQIIDERHGSTIDVERVTTQASE